MSALPVAIFLLLLGKLIPLYVLVALGYVAGTRLHVARDAVARLLLYVIVPAVTFYGVATVQLSASVLSLPLFFFFVCGLMAFFAFPLARRLWPDNTAHILAYTCGTGNNGYFGYPLVLALFGEQAFSIAVVAGIGFLLYECTVGLLLLGYGATGAQSAWRRVLCFPLPYAFALGLAWNALHLPLPQQAVDLLLAFRGAFTVLGMMLVGLGLTEVKKLFVDGRFLAMALMWKFLLWPIAMGAVIALDTAVFHLYPDVVHRVMFVLAVVPLAANTVAWATELKMHPDKAASAVFLSTVVALVYIPLLVAFVL